MYIYYSIYIDIHKYLFLKFANSSYHLTAQRAQHVKAIKRWTHASVAIWSSSVRKHEHDRFLRSWIPCFEKPPKVSGT